MALAFSRDPGPGKARSLALCVARGSNGRTVLVQFVRSQNLPNPVPSPLSERLSYQASRIGQIHGLLGQRLSIQAGIWPFRSASVPPGRRLAF